MICRLQRDDDQDLIYDVHRAAFASDLHGRLPAAIGSSPQFVPGWSWVIERDDELIGHGMASWTFLDLDGGGSVDVPHLSPLAVLPGHQRRGAGSALIGAITDAVDLAGAPFLLLEGSPGFYGRFGFQDARIHGVRFPLPPGAPAGAGQLRPLTSYRQLAGRVRYPPAFLAATTA